MPLLQIILNLPFLIIGFGIKFLFFTVKGMGKETRYSSRNNVYLIYKNMPLLQIILNLPFLIIGFGIKFLFFTVKGMGKEYLAGIKNGFSISFKGKKVPFSFKNMPNYCKIQWELWINMFRRLAA